jgi:hypothetical protein
VIGDARGAPTYPNNPIHEFIGSRAPERCQGFCEFAEVPEPSRSLLFKASHDARVEGGGYVGTV